MIWTDVFTPLPLVQPTTAGTLDPKAARWLFLMIRGTEIGIAVVHETLLLETGSMGLPEVEILHLLRRAPCHSDPLACDNGTVAVEDRQICDADGYWREQAWLLKNSIAVSFGRKRRARMPYKRPSRNRDTFSIIRVSRIACATVAIRARWHQLRALKECRAPVPCPMSE